MINIKEFLGLGYYVSELDSFLTTFDEKNQKLSVSQAKEKKQYARIFTLRDSISHQPKSKDDLWDSF